MMRVLLFLLVLILGVIAIRNKFGKKADTPKVGDELARRDRLDATEAMHRCAHCGVYVPASESITDGDAHYCSEQHRSLHVK